jgi:hypothetical protein
MNSNTKKLRAIGITFPRAPGHIQFRASLWEWLADVGDSTGIVFRGVRIYGPEWDRATRYVVINGVNGIARHGPWNKQEILTAAEEALRRKVIGWGPDE